MKYIQNGILRTLTGKNMQNQKNEIYTEWNFEFELTSSMESMTLHEIYTEWNFE